MIPPIIKDVNQLIKHPEYADTHRWPYIGNMGFVKLFKHHPQFQQHPVFLIYAKSKQHRIGRNIGGDQSIGSQLKMKALSLKTIPYLYVNISIDVHWYMHPPSYIGYF